MRAALSLTHTASLALSLTHSRSLSHSLTHTVWSDLAGRLEGSALDVQVEARLLLRVDRFRVRVRVEGLGVWVGGLRVEG